MYFQGALTLKTIRKFGRYCDIILGIFMITIGFYGILGALKTYKEKRMKRKDLGDLNPQYPSSSPSRDGYLKEDAYIKGSTNIGLIVRANSDLKNVDSNSDVEESYSDTYVKSVHDHTHEHDKALECCRVLPFIDMHDSTTQKIVSFFIGEYTYIYMHGYLCIRIYR
jgi:hypothetical protein